MTPRVGNRQPLNSERPVSHRNDLTVFKSEELNARQEAFARDVAEKSASAVRRARA